ncbi:MAG: 3'-5' exonuclease [Bacteroidales bacterium]|nr:3'-5' exonuclease [Bacteroidales bacterium]
MECSFTAIDFETAHPQGWSICQVGLVRFEQGVITKEMSILVQPPDNYYWYKFIEIHGITPHDTLSAPTFDKIWPLIDPFITGQVVVAHNGLSFDFPVLSKTLAYYGMQAPEYTKHDTYRIFKQNLKSLCQFHNIPLHHHDALSDAKACAELYIMHLDGKNNR